MWVWEKASIARILCRATASISQPMEAEPGKTLASKKPGSSRRFASIPRTPTSFTWRPVAMRSGPPQTAEFIAPRMAARPGSVSSIRTTRQARWTSSWTRATRTSFTPRLTKSLGSLGTRSAAAPTAAYTKQPMVATPGPTSLTIRDCPKGKSERLDWRLRRHVRIASGHLSSRPIADYSGRTTVALPGSVSTPSTCLTQNPPSYNHIVADTQDPNTVYIPAYPLLKSTDGGETFRTVPTEHGDNHALWIDPTNDKRMIEGNDGGATVTLDGCASWSMEHNQPTAELFSLAIDDQHPYWLYGAQNDESENGVPSRTNVGRISLTDSKQLPGGEGGGTAVTPDGNILYGADRGEIHRYDRRTGQTLAATVWPDDMYTFAAKDLKYRFYYNTPILLSPLDPNVLYAGGQSGFPYHEWRELLERHQPGSNTQPARQNAKNPWRTVHLGMVVVVLGFADSGAGGVASQRGELWAGTDDSTVQMTTDDGKTWKNSSPRTCRSGRPSRISRYLGTDPGRCIWRQIAYRVSDRSPYFYKTTNYGRTWQKITNGIGENDFAWVIREDPVRSGLLYAGTEMGVYVSFDDGTSWQPLKRNLPAVEARNMLVKGNDLVVATNGRGFWIMDNVSALRQITPEVTSATAHLFKIEPTYRYLPVQVLSARRPFRPEMQYAGEGGVAYEDVREPDGSLRRVFLNGGGNPSGGVTIDYYLKQAPSEAGLTILDGKGGVVRQFSSQGQGNSSLSAEAGTNRFIWDMRYPGAREIPMPSGYVPSEYPRAQAPVGAPGHYTARLSVGGQTYEEPFEIRIIRG